ncbi:starvation-inducible DNA-binding protein [Rhizomicrobium palustre]|uniref:Starvation-inducible DNA-binding protein n=1 Tax=Rhizomicrobium palustre TaxID=189966 RepID=A0A846MTE9_9PROT|nr:DNA starvation/stationary phase protection protein Dps [Rhizomicrobium palustre]NIK86778.1 starvation-inducible DNA-binding protein [Rhizomicrobium palustre]
MTQETYIFASHLDLAQHIRKESAGLLQARLSDSLDLEAQLKQAHWNVKGRDFFQLHELFDKLHGEIEDLTDTLAERITTIGGIADGRVQTTSAKTTLYEYPLQAKGGAAHLKAVAAALAEFGKHLRADIDKAAAIGDADTADVFTEVSRAVDKQLWFVEAHLVEE